ncbi:hypothetical protein, partial [Luteitalea sp.]|uniref:hypothetical protein n=1 Tax=Luteitalea sp. TaxID=2004800 RepID=UPI0025BAEF15
MSRIGPTHSPPHGRVRGAFALDVEALVEVQEMLPTGETRVPSCIQRREHRRQAQLAVERHDEGTLGVLQG